MSKTPKMRYCFNCGDELTIPSREFQGRGIGEGCEARSIIEAVLFHEQNCDCRALLSRTPDTVKETE